jgi:3D (Asp-Asp-Asp) domain-containing protein
MTNAIEGESNHRQCAGDPASGSDDRLCPSLAHGPDHALAPSHSTSGAAVSQSLAGSDRAASLICRVVRRIVNGIRSIAPLVLSLSCQSNNDAATTPPPVTASAPAPESTSAAETGPRPVGQFTITFYYVVGEDEVASKPVLVASNDNRTGEGSGSEDGDAALTAITTSERVTLYTGGGKCEPIAEVSKAFASQLALQGTGKLRDGRVVNIFGACNCGHSPCFKVTHAQWGTAGTGRPLQPFRTIAVDPKVVKLGSLLYVPLLEGRLMPGRAPWGGYVHDGCVIADDTGGHIAGNRIDLFVGRRAYFLGLGRSGSGGSHAWARHVPVFDGSGICERKDRRIGRKSVSI